MGDESYARPRDRRRKSRSELNGLDPFAGLEHDVNYWELPDETATLTFDHGGLPAQDRQLRFLTYTGLFDLLVEAVWESCETDGERERRLSRILGRFKSLEPTLRFALFEKSNEVEGLELVSRMRGKDIAVTEGWLLPRLERDVEIYRERIEAMKMALRERTT
jgi:hypothetical protein